MVMLAEGTLGIYPHHPSLEKVSKPALARGSSPAGRPAWTPLLASSSLMAMNFHCTVS